MVNIFDESQIISTSSVWITYSIQAVYDNYDRITGNTRRIIESYSTLAEAYDSLPDQEEESYDNQTVVYRDITWETPTGSYVECKPFDYWFPYAPDTSVRPDPWSEVPF